MPTWRAQYNDGNTLPQFYEGREVAKYNDIDRTRLSKFTVIGDDDKDIVTVHLTEGQRLIYRIRVDTYQDGSAKEKVTLVGWQETRNGANFQSLTLIFKDHIEVANHFDPKLKWLYPITLREEEKA